MEETIILWDMTVFETPPEGKLPDLVSADPIEWAEWVTIPFRDVSFSMLDLLFFL